jgi:hypothetical protein
LFDFIDAEKEGECRYQLKEGCFYDYEFSDPEIMPLKKQIIFNRIAESNI